MDLQTPDISTARRIEPMPRKADRPQTWPKGRTCEAARLCPPGTLLSIYNEGTECALCEAKAPKPAPEDLATVMAEAPAVA